MLVKILYIYIFFYYFIGGCDGLQFCMQVEGQIFLNIFIIFFIEKFF